MCERYSFTSSIEQITEEFGISHPAEFRSSYNIAPKHHAYVITNDAPDTLQYITWGLIPYWSNDGANNGKLFNAWKEGIAARPSFRLPIRKKKCLILADGFYEWQRVGVEKIPYRIKHKEDKILAFAGIWDIWYQGDFMVKSFSIITIPSTSKMKQISPRMPVIIMDAEKRTTWLENENLDTSLNLLRPLDQDQLSIYKISNKINSIGFNNQLLHEQIV